MAGSSAKPENRYHVRSISMPSRSHPSTLRVDEELHKLKTWETLLSTSTTPLLKAEKIQAGLSGLGELYECVDDLFHLPLIQQALIQDRQDKWVVVVLEESVRLLDVCGTTRDILMQMKESVRDLQSGLRRRKGEESSIESNVSAYICARKTVKKDIVKGLEALKRMNRKIGPSLLLGSDNLLSVVVRVLREVSAITISIFQLLLSFLTVSVSKPKPSGWSLVSKLMYKGLVGCEGEEWNTNEVKSVDVALRTLLKDADVEKVQLAQKRLQALEVSIEGLEDGLESMFRRQIQTRVSLLNILTP